MGAHQTPRASWEKLGPREESVEESRCPRRWWLWGPPAKQKLWKQGLCCVCQTLWGAGLGTLGQTREPPGSVRCGDTVVEHVGPGLAQLPSLPVTSCCTCVCLGVLICRMDMKVAPTS